ncbi:hypothetical protein ACVWXO_000209 [Bradyrhizobium sp. LM2.7]
MSDGGDTAPVASQPPTSGVAVAISSSEEEINAAKRHMDRLREEFCACRQGADGGLEEEQEKIDQFVEAGSAVLDYYASLPPAVAPSILSDADARRCCFNVVDAGFKGHLVGRAILLDLDLEGRRRKSKAVFQQIVKSNATPAALSRVAPGLKNAYVPVIEFWRKKLLRSERMQSACVATANLPSTTPEERKAVEAAIRVRTGGGTL